RITTCCRGSRWPVSVLPSLTPCSKPSSASHGEPRTHIMGMGEEMTAGSPADRIERHKFADRVYHWVMAAAMLILLTTAFLPILGVKFAWVDIHWITGLVLTILVLYHIIRALFWQNFWAMMIDSGDLKDPFAKPGKYNLAQKLYHLAIAVLVLSAIASG